MAKFMIILIRKIIIVDIKNYLNKYKKIPTFYMKFLRCQRDDKLECISFAISFKTGLKSNLSPS